MNKSLIFIMPSSCGLGGSRYVNTQLLKAFIDVGYKVYPILLRGLKVEVPENIKEIVDCQYYADNKSLQTVIEDSLSLIPLRNFKLNMLLRYLKPDILWFMSSLPRALAEEVRQYAYIYVYYHMLLPWYYEIRGYYRKYYWHDLSMFYLATNMVMSRIFTYDMNPFSVADKVLVNSKYMKLLAKRYWRKEVHVLSPPIHLKSIGKEIKGRNHRHNYIICFGRISPEKLYEETLKAVAITKTKPKVIIAGSLNKKKDIKYLRHLLHIARFLNVKIEIIPNVHEKDKWSLFSEAMIYVHNARAEHFGITVVEAMALGTPVIVHKSGEPYYGITERGRYGLVYNTVKDLAYYIDKLFAEEHLWQLYHNLALKRAHDYDYTTFVYNVKKLLENKTMFL